MAYSSSRLPSRFPVGTKFVIEGKRAAEGQVQVFNRYLEFPDGTFFPLPAPPFKAEISTSRTARQARPLAQPLTHLYRPLAEFDFVGPLAGAAGWRTGD